MTGSGKIIIKTKSIIKKLLDRVLLVFTTFAEYGTQWKHRQQDTWPLLVLVPFAREEVRVHNTDISLLFISTSVWALMIVNI